MIAVDGREAIWQDVECGGYAADLSLWTDLAREAAGPVLELGAGTGRVALHLAGEGFEVTALERSPQLLDALRERAGSRGLPLRTVHADTREFRLDARFGLICAPMQLVHLLGGSGGRASMLSSIAAHLHPGGRAAIALLAQPELSAAEDPLPLPDVAERDGWVYSSQPVEVIQVSGALEVRRLRQLVSPTGELGEEIDTVRLDDLDAAELEAEALEAGLVASERLSVPATDDHVGSDVCVFVARR